MSIALAKSPLPSARNSILSAPLAFFHSFITKPSLTAVTAMVSTPLALMASAFCTNPGRWFLWQVGVNAPGTANSTNFLPLNTSSVVFQPGPSAVITLNFASGRRSPTLMAMVDPLCGWGLEMGLAGVESSAPAELVEMGRDLNRTGGRDQREGQARAVGALARWYPVEDEGEALQAGR